MDPNPPEVEPNASCPVWWFGVVLHLTWVVLWAMACLLLEKRNITLPHVFCSFVYVLPLNACAYVSHVTRMHVNCSCKCFQIERFARWGNNLIQLIHAAQIAHFVGYGKIYIPMNFLLLTQPIIWNGTVEIIPGDPPGICNSGLFWRLYLGPDIQDVHEVPDDFRLEYLRRLNVVKGDSATLSIHIRTGDIFSMPHDMYGQPPCVYYKEIIKMRQWKDVIVTAEDLQNPCVHEIANNVIMHIGRPLLSDMRYLLGAQNLVIGRGTFGLGLSIMSIGINNLFAFDNPHPDWDIYAQSHFVINKTVCLPTQEYRRIVLTNWTKSEKQLQMMVTYNKSCQEWIKTP